MANRVSKAAGVNGIRTKKTPQRTREFLDGLAKGFPVGVAAQQAGCSRPCVYAWRAADPVFAADWDVSYEQGSDVIEEEMRRRGADGWDDPVYQQGEKVGEVRRFSDNLLLAVARSRRPERFANNLKVDANVKAEVTVNIAERLRLAHEQRKRFEVIDGDAGKAQPS